MFRFSEANEKYCTEIVCTITPLVIIFFFLISITQFVGTYRCACVYVLRVWFASIIHDETSAQQVHQFKALSVATSAEHLLGKKALYALVHLKCIFGSYIIALRCREKLCDVVLFLVLTTYRATRNLQCRVRQPTPMTVWFLVYRQSDYNSLHSTRGCVYSIYVLIYTVFSVFYVVKQVQLHTSGEYMCRAFVS